MAVFGTGASEADILAQAAEDPNLKDCTTIDDLHAKLKELSVALSAEDKEGSAFKSINFEGTNPYPVFVPNAFKANKGCDGMPVTSYYRYAVKDEAQAAKASGIKAPAAFKGPSNPTGGSAAPKPKAAGGGGGGVRKSVKQLCEMITARDPACTCADFSGQGSFQMRDEACMEDLVTALKGDGSSPHMVANLILKDCGISGGSAAILGTFLETDTIITHLDLSNNKPLKEEAAIALAKGLTKNTGVLELNLMGLGGGIAIRSESICAAFIECFRTNVTLKKPIWRLDHPLAHTLARLVTRNTSIARCASQGKEFDTLLPDHLKNTGVVVNGSPAAGTA